MHGSREGVPIADYVTELAGRAERRELWPYADEAAVGATQETAAGA